MNPAGTVRRTWLSLYDQGKSHDAPVEASTVLDVFSALVTAGPDKVCVSSPDRVLTRQEAWRDAGAVAAYLYRNGVQAGDRVAVYLQNSPEFVVAFLATWQLGAVPVPVNPMYRERELTTLLCDSGTKAVIALAELTDRVVSVLTGSAVTTILAVGDCGENDHIEQVHRWDSAVATSPLSPVQSAESGAPGCLAYTSGTTGPPKGAVNTHEKLLFSSRTFQHWMNLTESDIILGIAPLFHITGLVGHLTTALVTGAELVLIGRFSPHGALRAIRERRPTFTVGAITAFQAIMDLPESRREDLASLTKIYTGGGPVPPALIEKFEDKFGTYLHPIYGLTESTSPAVITPARRRAPLDERTGSLSVGVPVYSTIVEIVGDNGRPVPPGEIGELVITGPQVIDRYWNEPPDTLSTLREGRLFTGDVGYMDEAGWVYLIDRKKDQINASGFKIWPREVEDVLYEHPAVREAAVVGVPHPYRGETVRAYVALHSDHHNVTTDDLITHCKAQMAAYKYPREVIILPELPKTSSGKILRRELREKKAGTH